MRLSLCPSSVLETVILKAIQAVSRYALENEAEFVADLKSVWDENKSQKRGYRPA